MSGLRGALLVAGTGSDAGKSVVATGICRWLARRGVRVAPFKAQNMALNSVVTAEGAEIGRAQAAQAAAAGVAPEAAMNPVLLKPAGERRSHVLLMGKPYGEVDARSYGPMRAALREPVLAALADLRERFDVVICEGAGSPAEINLRDDDLANMGLARAADLPVVIVGDIDRGGVFAGLFGCLAAARARGPAPGERLRHQQVPRRPGILQPGLEMLERLTGRPTLGVLPWRRRLWLDVEDSLALEAPREAGEPPIGPDALDVAVIRLRWMSNFTDLDALAAEPGVAVRFSRSPADVARADLVVLPGTRATVEDLAGLRTDGLDAALADRAARGGPSWASAAATRCWAGGSWTRWRAGRARWRAWACCRSRPSSARTRCCAGGPVSPGPSGASPPRASRSATAGWRAPAASPCWATGRARRAVATAP